MYLAQGPLQVHWGSNSQTSRLEFEHHRHQSVLSILLNCYYAGTFIQSDLHETHFLSYHLVKRETFRAGSQTPLASPIQRRRVSHCAILCRAQLCMYVPTAQPNIRSLYRPAHIEEAHCRLAIRPQTQELNSALP